MARWVVEAKGSGSVEKMSVEEWVGWGRSEERESARERCWRRRLRRRVMMKMAAARRIMKKEMRTTIIMIMLVWLAAGGGGCGWGWGWKGGCEGKDWD